MLLFSSHLPSHLIKPSELNSILEGITTNRERPVKMSNEDRASTEQLALSMLIGEVAKKPDLANIEIIKQALDEKLEEGYTAQQRLLASTAHASKEYAAKLRLTLMGQTGNSALSALELKQTAAALGSELYPLYTTNSDLRNGGNTPEVERPTVSKKP